MISQLSDKTLALLGAPLGATLTAIFIGVTLVLAGRRRMGAGIILAATCFLWVAAMPATANAILSSLERDYPPRPVETYTTADVAIVLGGGFRTHSLTSPYADFGEASDRLMMGYRFLKAGKVRMILISGGQVFGNPGDPTEAEDTAGVLVEWGVPRAQIITEPESRNTHENAIFSERLWREYGFHSGLLVTSVSHMPRALATFRAAGLDLAPASTDTQLERPDPFPLPYLPKADSLEKTTAALKEFFGLLVYRMRGWA